MDQDFVKRLRGKTIFLDSIIYINALNQNPDFPSLAEIFQSISAAKTIAFSSVLTLMEVLVRPSALAQDQLISDHLEFVTANGLIRLIDFDQNIAIAAAKIRATHKLSTPDSIQLATAVAVKCNLFLTTDRDFHKMPDIGLKVIVITPAKN